MKDLGKEQGFRKDAAPGHLPQKPRLQTSPNTAQPGEEKTLGRSFYSFPVLRGADSDRIKGNGFKLTEETFR